MKITERQRAYFYRVSLAVIALGGIYGLLTDAQAVGWGALALAVTGNGLAALNTSTKTPPVD